MKVIISRTYDPLETRGTLFVMEGEKKLFECKTIELPWKENKKEISCIPEGTYDVVKTLSKTFGKSFLLKNVPARSAVMIHKGNFAAGKQVDTRGCILPGMAFSDANKDGILDVVDSTTAFNKLLEILPASFKLIIV